MKKISPRVLALFLLLLGTACIAAPETPTSTPTPTQIYIITATLPSTQTPIPTQTPAPTATPAPFVPIEGQTTSQLNVRLSPSAASEQVGTLQIFDKMQIIGKDQSNNWWMIDFPASPSGRGWITMQFVQVTVDTSSVPVIDASVQGTSDAPIAETNPTEGVGVPTAEPTPVYATAPDDGDSVEAPAINLTLSKDSVSYLDHSSDISSPEGDASDWIRFQFDGKTEEERIVTVVVSCFGSSKLNMELVQNGVTLQSWQDMQCSLPHQLQLYLYVSAPYYLHLSPAQGNTALNYISYDLSVQLNK